MSTVKGQIYMIDDTAVISERFSKRLFVVETDKDSDYPQLIPMEFTQDNVGKLDDYKIGDSVEVEINMRGRKWESPSGDVKYFLTLQAWKIEKVSNDAPLEEPNPPSNENNESDDLPF